MVLLSGIRNYFRILDGHACFLLLPERFDDLFIDEVGFNVLDVLLAPTHDVVDAGQIRAWHRLFPNQPFFGSSQTVTRSLAMGCGKEQSMNFNLLVSGKPGGFEERKLVLEVRPCTIC